MKFNAFNMVVFQIFFAAASFGTTSDTYPGLFANEIASRKVGMCFSILKCSRIKTGNYRTFYDRHNKDLFVSQLRDCALESGFNNEQANYFANSVVNAAQTEPACLTMHHTTESARVLANVKIQLCPILCKDYLTYLAEEEGSTPGQVIFQEFLKKMNVSKLLSKASIVEHMCNNPIDRKAAAGCVILED